MFLTVWVNAHGLLGLWSRSMVTMASPFGDISWNPFVVGFDPPSLSLGFASDLLPLTVVQHLYPYS